MVEEMQDQSSDGSEALVFMPMSRIDEVSGEDGSEESKAEEAIMGNVMPKFTKSQDSIGEMRPSQSQQEFARVNSFGADADQIIWSQDRELQQAAAEGRGRAPMQMRQLFEQNQSQDSGYKTIQNGSLNVSSLANSANQDGRPEEEHKLEPQLRDEEAKIPTLILQDEPPEAEPQQQMCRQPRPLEQIRDDLEEVKEEEGQESESEEEEEQKMETNYADLPTEESVDLNEVEEDKFDEDEMEDTDVPEEGLLQPFEGQDSAGGEPNDQSPGVLRPSRAIFKNRGSLE